jgi:hypothetical protein
LNSVTGVYNGVTVADGGTVAGANTGRDAGGIAVLAGEKTTCGASGAYWAWATAGAADSPTSENKVRRATERIRGVFMVLNLGRASNEWPSFAACEWLLTVIAVAGLVPDVNRFTVVCWRVAWLAMSRGNDSIRFREI